MHSASTERGSLHCASDCWLLYLVVTHAAEHECYICARPIVYYPSSAKSIMAGDEKLKIKRRSTAAAAVEWESAELLHERETERIRSCFTWGYWVTFPSFVTITYANHNQCTINNSSIKLLLYFLAQTRGAPLHSSHIMRPAPSIVSSFVHILVDTPPLKCSPRPDIQSIFPISQNTCAASYPNNL